LAQRRYEGFSGEERDISRKNNKQRKGKEKEDISNEATFQPVEGTQKKEGGLARGKNRDRKVAVHVSDPVGNSTVTPLRAGTEL